METLGTKNEGQPRQANTETVIGFLERTQAAAHIQNILAEREQLPDFNAFKEFLIRINGMARDIPIRQRSLDGTNVEMKGFVDTVNVPRHEDKDGLLRYAYNGTHRVERGDLKYMLPAVINAVHPFADGNGRTSRVLHLLLREYSTENERSDEMRKALSEDGRYDSFDINPGRITHEIEHIVMKRHGWQFDNKNGPERLGEIVSGIATVELQELKTDAVLERNAIDFFRLYAEDTRYALTAIQMCLGDEGISRLSAHYNDIKRISPKRMAQDLSPDDWRNILARFYQLKKEHVEVLVDAFTAPEEYRTPDNSETIRNYFVQQIEKDTTLH
jgi:hypothetical protein